MNPLTTTLPIQLSGIVTLQGDSLADSILQFWAIPLVGSLLLLVASLQLAPRLAHVLVRLMTRGINPSDGVRVSSTAVPETKMFDLGDKGWIEDYVNMETIDWHESTQEEQEMAGLVDHAGYPIPF